VRVTAGVVVGLVLLGALITGLAPAVGGTQLVAADTAIGSVAGVGRQLFEYDKLLVPFELTAPLLLVAIIGAVSLWRRQEAQS
jgi:NADH:ubiquinone oxidoreductase subunit 6 (subunit J)